MDVQQQLGLSLIAEDGDGRITDLFSGQRLNLHQTASKTDQELLEEADTEPEAAKRDSQTLH